MPFKIFLFITCLHIKNVFLFHDEVWIPRSGKKESDQWSNETKMSFCKPVVILSLVTTGGLSTNKTFIVKGRTYQLNLIMSWNQLKSDFVNFVAWYKYPQVEPQVDMKKVLPTPVNKIPIKLNPLSLPLLVCFGDFKFHMLHYMWLFFPFSFIMESYLGRGQRLVSLCFLSTNQTGPAWGQTNLEFAVRTAVPGFCLSVQPHDFGLDPCLPEPHVPHLWEQDNPHDLTRANMPWPED